MANCNKGAVWNFTNENSWYKHYGMTVFVVSHINTSVQFPELQFFIWCMRTGYTFTDWKCLFLRLKLRCLGWFLAHIKSSWSVITDTDERQVIVLLRVKCWDGEPVMQPQVTEHHIMLPKCSQAPRKQIIIVIWHTVTERLSESHPANKWQSDD